jgi:hypothetical protein
MADPLDDLRATSEALEADAERLAELEERKQRLDLTEPAMAELSREIETLVHRMADKATAERELAEEIQADPTVTAGGSSDS